MKRFYFSFIPGIGFGFEHRTAGLVRIIEINILIFRFTFCFGTLPKFDAAPLSTMPPVPVPMSLLASSSMAGIAAALTGTNQEGEHTAGTIRVCCPMLSLDYQVSAELLAGISPAYKNLPILFKRAAKLGSDVPLAYLESDDGKLVISARLEPNEATAWQEEFPLDETAQ
jgi:hypothetical protein